MRVTGLLASVCSTGEAHIALQSYADLIDCKNPHAGALGALPPETITRIVELVDGNRLVSATTGDFIRGIRELRLAVAITADCGVDYIKVGLFDGETAAAQIRGLQPMTREHDLIAVCFADRYDSVSLVPRLAASGFRGVMIDTADKGAGRLTELWTDHAIARFVRAARLHGLLCGLAGRLARDDIARLLPLQADYLGFRSALCRGDRCTGLDHGAMMEVRDAIPMRPDTSMIQRPRVALH